MQDVVGKVVARLLQVRLQKVRRYTSMSLRSPNLVSLGFPVPSARYRAAVSRTPAPDASRSILSMCRIMTFIRSSTSLARV